MAEVEVRLPQFGMGMLEGTITVWHKSEGDVVAADEVIAEVEAAKTNEDLVAPAAGVLDRVLVGEGETVPVNELLAVITVGDGAELAPPGLDAAAPGVVAALPELPGYAARRQVEPRARRRAGELGVDLDAVVGTGPGGRVTEDDVVAASRVAGDRPSRPVSPAPAGSSVPFTRTRATIAARMVASLQSSAQFTLTTTADVTELVVHRSGSEGEPIRPTYTDYVIKAAALALRDHPRLNAAVDGDQTMLYSVVNIGVATSLDDGLVTPVVRDADTKSLAEIAGATAALAQQARAGELTMAELTGSTFTVTSLGGQGIDTFTPILNPPEVAILGVGRIVDQPSRSGDLLVWRKVMTLSLTVDHRVVDGHPAAVFLGAVARLLSEPYGLEAG